MQFHITNDMFPSPSDTKAHLYSSSSNEIDKKTHKHQLVAVASIVLDNCSL